MRPLTLGADRPLMLGADRPLMLGADHNPRLLGPDVDLPQSGGL
jgi:hypothetical protein